MRRGGLALLSILGLACAPARPAVAPEAPPVEAPAAAPAAVVEAPAAVPDAPPVAPSPAEPDADASDGADDDDDGMDAPKAPGPAARDPLLELKTAELELRFRKDAHALGSISVGRPGAGLLVNGIQLQPRREVLLLSPDRAWATRETLDAMVHCIEEVDRRFEGTTPLPIGDFSARNGGRISPHLSHQAGRDVDVGYYLRGGSRGFLRATADNLDLPRTWALVKTALTDTPVDMIFVDISIQKLLAEFALKSGEDPKLVDDAFQSQGKNARAPIRHIKGHGNHLHFRFHNPVAEELGTRLARVLPRPSTAPPPKTPQNVNAKHELPPPGGTTYEQIRARSGDTLVVWAKRYGTTVEEIQRANGLSSIALKIGTVYRIPVKSAPKGGKRAGGGA